MEIRPIKVEELRSCLRQIDSRFHVGEYLHFSKRKTGGQYLFEMKLRKHPNPFRKRSFNYEDSYLEMLASFLKEGGSFGSFDDERCVAVAVTSCERWNKTLKIWEFAVDKTYRKQGIGKQLMEIVFEHAKENQMRSVFLETETNNVGAIRFYEKMGFEIVGFDDTYYTNSDPENLEVAVFMRKKMM
jgi:ribosomal protein S18 acetylase RimI-like enzyme